MLPAGLVRDLDIQPTTIKVSAWGRFPLEVLGETLCSVTYNNITVHAYFVVVKLSNSIHGKDSLPLFSANLCNQMHML